MKDDGAIPDWALRELQKEFFSALANKLARHDGAALTRGECEILLELVRKRPEPKRRRGRPAKEQAIFMAFYCLTRESRGEPTKVAVPAVARVYGVSCATVYAARRKMLLSK
jgi:hypothetical protein